MKRWSLIFALILSATACDANDVDPYLSGEIPRAHPERTFSKVSAGDLLSAVPRPIVPVRGPAIATKQSCARFLDTYDGLAYDCSYSSKNGIIYLTDGEKVLGAELHLTGGRWFHRLPFGLKFSRDLPFGLTRTETLAQIKTRFEKAGIKVSDGPYDRHMGLGFYWPLNPSIDIIDGGYGAIELDTNGNVAVIRVTPWDGD